eukprot:4178760-Alexandrium_andersonii.AAC.1
MHGSKEAYMARCASRNTMQQHAGAAARACDLRRCANAHASVHRRSKEGKIRRCAAREAAEARTAQHRTH